MSPLQIQEKGSLVEPHQRLVHSHISDLAVKGEESNFLSKARTFALGFVTVFSSARLASVIARLSKKISLEPVGRLLLGDALAALMRLLFRPVISRLS